MIEDLVACSLCGVMHPWPEMTYEGGVPVCLDKLQCEKALKAKRKKLFLCSGVLSAQEKSRGITPK